MLEQLTNLDGVSGNEEAVRAFILEHSKPFCDAWKQDTLGNLIGYKKCKSPGITNPMRIMIAAHMDEVGFMISQITAEGYLAFIQVGGVDEKILPGKCLRIGPNKLPGIVTLLPDRGLVIDIGARNREQAQEHVALGDYVAFSSEYTRLGQSVVKAKAFDDRVGCAVLMEILKGSYPFDLYACFTVQEEVGLRGAELATNFVKPHLAFVLEGTTCADLSGVDPKDVSTRLGNGPAISILDRSTYYPSDLNQAIWDHAQKHHIPLQVKNTFTGGNDSGKIQRSLDGVKVAVISAPVRYIHSPVSVLSLQDFEVMKSLVSSFLTEMDFSPWLRREAML